MLIARLVKVSDLDRLFKLTKTGGRGLTTMPKSKEELEAIVQELVQPFKNVQLANPYKED